MALEIQGDGGEGGIRTPGPLARTPHFECGAIDHSATSPWTGLSPFGLGREIAAIRCDGKGDGASDAQGEDVSSGSRVLVRAPRARRTKVSTSATAR
jgi:hypothetical protein